MVAKIFLIFVLHESKKGLTMEIFLLITVILVASWSFAGFLRSRNEKNGYDRGGGHYNRNAHTYNEKPKERIPQKTSRPSRLFRRKPYFEEEAILWCANFLAVDNKELRSMIKHPWFHYNDFYMRKRSGGYRAISAPHQPLLAIQQTIYHRILLPVNVHPVATGFRQNMSIVQNARPHLGKNQVLKTDIRHFFGSIRRRTVVKAFKAIGYPGNISKVLAELCCKDGHLPQGAPTSPALSNIIAYEMDQKLQALSVEHNLTYTRYADDLTFSGNTINPNSILPQIAAILRESRFVLKETKTKYMPEHKRKIITGISISSGTKLTIPKVKKRELRKNIHFILTRGLAEHQRYIGSTDPVYLKRIIGYLHYWQSVEPDNRYVTDSIIALKRL